MNSAGPAPLWVSIPLQCDQAPSSSAGVAPPNCTALADTDFLEPSALPSGAPSLKEETLLP